MAKETQPKLLERIVTSPKGIHCHNKQGERIFAKQGDTVFLPPNSAKAFAHMLEDPKVAKAKAAAEAAEAVAAAAEEEREETPVSKDKPASKSKSAGKDKTAGGDSDKS